MAHPAWKVLVAALGFGLTALAQGPGRMPVRAFTSADGMPEAHVTAMLQDRQGRYWVGGDLAVYLGDGASFTALPLPGAGKRPLCRSLVEDAEGGVYVEGALRLWRLEGQTWSLVDEGLPPKGDTDSDHLAKDGAGMLWLMWGGALYRIDAPRHYRKIALPDRGMAYMAARPHAGGVILRIENRVWIGGSQGWVPLPAISIRPGEQFRWSVQEDQHGVFWAGTRDRIFRLLPGAASWEPVPDPDVAQGYATAICSPRPGEVWAMGDQIARRLDASEPTLSTTSAFSTYSLVLLLRDREDNLWADRSGLHRLGGPWRTYGGADGLPIAGCWQSLRDGQGRLWVNTTLGLFRSLKGGWERVRQGVYHAQMTIGPDGFLWITERTGHVLRFDLSKSQSFPAPDLPFLRDHKAIRGILSTHRNVIFPIAGNLVAVGSWRGGQWTWETAPLPFQEASVRTFRDQLDQYHLLVWDKHGHLVHCIEHGPWENLPFPTENSITDLHMSEPNTMWVLQYNPPELQEMKRTLAGWNRGRAVPLAPFGPINQAYTLAMLAEGETWVGTDQGMLAFNLGDVTQARRYTSLDSLPIDDCNQFGLLVEKDRIWVSTGTGIACYDRTKAPALPALPAPLLLATQVDGGLWSLTPPDTLGAETRQVNFSIGVSSPARRPYLTFEWRDLEASSTWQTFSGSHLAFLNPAPGLHRIQVRHVAPGAPASAAFTVSFRMLPPWWRRAWALLLWISLISGLGWGMHRRRLRRMRRHNEELATLVELRTSALAASEARQREASQAKSAFLADMSHELRTPLNAILLYSELIHQDAEEMGSADLAKDSSRILSAGRHLLSLINGILDLSKVEAGKMTVTWETTSLKTLLEEVAVTLAPLAQERENALILQVEPQDLACQTDILKLRQVLINLASNAIKFTAAGRVTLRAHTEERTLILTVQDTGVGMTPEQASRLFQAYQQPTQESGYKAGGTGLGLTISQKYVELLGGSIDVSSIQGEGTTFLIRLPLGNTASSNP